MAHNLALITLFSVAYTLPCLLLPSGKLSLAGNQQVQDTCGIMRPLWQAASGKVDRAWVAPCEWINDFYSSAFARRKVYHFTKRDVEYVPIWKAANMAIRCNLEYAEANGTYDMFAHFDEWSQNSGTRVFAFTLVREPLSRFVSGFATISSGDVKLDQDCESRNKSSFEFQEMNSPERARLFIQDLLGGNLSDACWMFKHVYSQLGTLNKNLDLHVGKLEDFKAEWAGVSREAGFQFPEFDSECGAHKTSSDEAFPPRINMENAVSLITKASSSVASLLSTNAALRGVLVCSVLLPDYVCLDYALPDGKDMCVDQGFFSSPEEFGQKAEDIKNNLCSFLEGPAGPTGW